jgi:hypothetical protein
LMLICQAAHSRKCRFALLIDLTFNALPALALAQRMSAMVKCLLQVGVR